MCNKAKSTIVVGYIRVGRGQNSWKNREVGVNNQVDLCKKKETKKWFSESLLVAACFCLLMYVIIKMESTKSKVCFIQKES